MSIIRKIAALFVAAVVSVGALGAVSVSAGAESIYDTAKEIKSGKEYVATGITENHSADYKFTATKSGTLKINLTAGFNYAYIYVYDKDGNQLSYNDYELISGSVCSSLDGLELEWNPATEKIKANISYEINKGTYYIRIQNSSYFADGDRKINMTATYPSATATKAKITCLTLTVNKGSTVQLGALVSPSGESVKWTSSKTSVATVSSSGKVTAKAKGSATITAKCGTSTQKIKIIVK